VTEAERREEENNNNDITETRIQELISLIRKEVCVEIDDPYKVSLTDVLIDEYTEKDSGRRRILIKNERSGKRYVIAVVDKTVGETKFEIWSKELPWKEISKSKQIGDRLKSYEIFEGTKEKAQIFVEQKIYPSLRKKWKLHEDARVEYDQLIEEQEKQEKAKEKERVFNEDTKLKATELVKDPSFFYKFGEAFNTGFILPDVKRIRYIVGEDDNKRLLGIHIGTAPIMDTINFLFGDYATVKDTLVKMALHLTGVSYMKRGYLTAAGYRYSDEREEADVLYLPEADTRGEKGRQLRFMRSDDGGFEFEYAYKDKNSNLMVTQKSRVDVKTIIITTNDVTFDEALQSGAWLFQTDDSRDLTNRVIEAKLTDFKESREVLSDEEIEIWNCAFDILTKNNDIPNSITIPYASNLKKLLDTRSSKSRRSPEKLGELLQKIAILRRYQKPEDLRGIADEIDLFIALRIGKSAITETITELTTTEEEVYEAVRKLEAKNKAAYIKADKEERKKLTDGVAVKQISDNLRYPHDSCYKLAESLTKKGFFTKTGGRGKGNLYFIKAEQENSSEIGGSRIPTSNDPKEVLKLCMELVYSENEVAMSTEGYVVVKKNEASNTPSKKSNQLYMNIDSKSLECLLEGCSDIKSSIVIDPVSGNELYVFFASYGGQGDLTTYKSGETNGIEENKTKNNGSEIGIRLNPNLDKTEEEKEEINKKIDLLDNLDAQRIAATRSGRTKGEIEGIRMLIHQQLDILELDGLKEIKITKGDKFDPTQHMEVVDTKEIDEMEEDRVFEIIRRGFSLNGAIYRDALVIVSRRKGKEKPTEEKIHADIEDAKKELEKLGLRKKSDEEDCDGFSAYSDVEPLPEPEERFCEECEDYKEVRFRGEKDGHSVFLCEKHGLTLDKFLFENGGRFQ